MNPELMEVTKPDSGNQESQLQNNTPAAPQPKPVKQRSQKQMEWSRQLGKRSAEFKKKKRETLVNKDTISIPEPQDFSNPEANAVQGTSQEPETSNPGSQEPEAEAVQDTSSNWVLYFGGGVLTLFLVYKFRDKLSLKHLSGPKENTGSKSQIKMGTTKQNISRAPVPPVTPNIMSME